MEVDSGSGEGGLDMYRGTVFKRLRSQWEWKHLFEQRL